MDDEDDVTSDEYFGTEVGRRVDARVAFDFDATGLPGGGGGVSASDTFSVQWRGFLLSERSETVTLWTRSDDGARGQPPGHGREAVS